MKKLVIKAMATMMAVASVIGGVNATTITAEAGYSYHSPAAQWHIIWKNEKNNIALWRSDVMDMEHFEPIRDDEESRKTYTKARNLVNMPKFIKDEINSKVWAAYERREKSCAYNEFSPVGCHGDSSDAVTPRGYDYTVWDFDEICPGSEINTIFDSVTFVKKLNKNTWLAVARGKHLTHGKTDWEYHFTRADWHKIGKDGSEEYACKL